MPLLVFLSLLPIVAGVGVSSLSDTSFNMLGFCMAMGSNLCFSARSICAKLLRSSLGKSMDNANLFVHVNAYGIIILLPLVLYFEVKPRALTSQHPTPPSHDTLSPSHAAIPHAALPRRPSIQPSCCNSGSSD